MREKACGAVVYKEECNELKFLLVYQHNGHYSFPKGHVEGNETEIETALREIKEETNLDVLIDSNYRKKITYFVEPKKVMKDVVYFIATPTTFNLKSQEGEIKECLWCSYEEVLKKIEYENAKQVFIETYNYLKEKHQ